MKFHAGTESLDFENLQFDTNWWLSTAPSERFFGTLKIGNGDYSELNVPNGSSLNLENLEDVIIYGETEGKQISLLNTQRISHTINLIEGASKEIWSVGVVVIGEHLDEWRKVKFESCSINTRMLSAWTPNVPIKPIFGSREKNYSITVPDDFTLIDDEESKISLVWQWNEKHSVTDLDLFIFPQLCFEVHDAMTFGEMSRKLIQPFLDLLSFATGEIDVITHLTGRISRDSISAPLIIYISGMPKASSNSTNLGFGNIIKFPTDFKSSSNLLSAWYGLYEKHRFSIREFFAVSNTGRFYDYQNFPRIVGALEAWAREEHPDLTKFDAETYGQVRSLVKSNFEGDVKDKLLNLIRNDSDLRTKLSTIISEAPEDVVYAVRLVPDFISRCINTRNSLVHVDDSGKNFLKDEVSLGLMILEVLYSSLILGELGIENSEISKLLHHRRGRMPVSYSANYLHASIEEREELF